MSKRELDTIFLKKLLESIGPSGREEQVRDVVIQRLKKIGYKNFVGDVLGSIVAIKKSKIKNAPKVLLLSHIDEVGFFVKNITESGLVKVAIIGGINPTICNHLRVKLLNRKNEILKGVCVVPCASLEKRSIVSTPEGLTMDFGFKSKKEALNSINIGDPIVYDSETIVIKDNLVSKAIDDRVGLYAIIKLLEEIKDVQLSFDLYAGFSVQEEVGTRGAKTITSVVNPDFAIVSDISYALDGQEGKVGGGVLVRPKDAGTIQQHSITNWFKDLLIKNKVKHQHYISLGGTDASQIHLHNEGVPTLQVCLTAKDIHTQSSIVSISDINTLIDTLKIVLFDLNLERIRELSKKYECRYF